MIEVQGLTKRFGGTLAVDDLTFSVKPGIVTGFLGPNGAGKTTTMRMILGLDRPTAGSATVKGVPYAQLDRPLATVGSLLDAKWVHPNRSARKHLEWMTASNGLPRKRIDEVLGLVGLGDVADKRAGGYSLGMSQRLGLAAALLGDPEVLLFDEPVNGLDPEGIVWIRRFMQHLASEGRTVLVSSHLLSEMAQTAEHLVVIGRGRLISDSSVTEFVDYATDTAVRVRGPHLEAIERCLRDTGLGVQFQPADALRPQSLTVTGATTDRIGDLLARQSLSLHELAGESGSLEDAFMRLTGDEVEYHGTGADDMVGSPGTPASGPVPGDAAAGNAEEVR